MDGGNLYVAGLFTLVGGVSANHIAKWDGTRWSALGSGIIATDVSGSVFALAVQGGNLYAGGNFNVAGGVTANNIAKWDGESWSELGSGLSGFPPYQGYVSAMAVDSNGNLYAGGDFVTAGGVSAHYIAKWNGASWSAVGSGTNGPVVALAVDGGNLYAGGRFTEAGGVTANNIARWDGTSWSPMGSGMDDAVGAIALAGSGNLYAGGSFANAGGVSAPGLAKWTGTSWSAVGSGVHIPVFTLAVHGGDLYAGGGYMGGGNQRFIAKWNGSEWSALGLGVNGDVRAIAVDGSGNLYAGGIFTVAGGVGAHHVAKWNGAAWSALTSGMGMSDFVYALAADGNGNVYAGGDFMAAGDMGAKKIAKWDGTHWSDLGGGMSGSYPDPPDMAPVYALAVRDGNLYAGGYFWSAGGAVAHSIARWDGASWSALGSGMSGGPGYVYALAADAGGNLYAGGDFTMAGGVSANRIAKWDGTNWSALGSGMNSNSRVRALAVDASGNLYAGGSFTIAGGVSASRIAKWDGTSWSALGSGMSGGHDDVLAIAVDASGNLYAGGPFTQAGGAAANNIAKWDGTAWSALGSGLNGEVASLAFDGSGNLYAGGEFTTAGGVSANNIAKWDGSEWSALGSGLNMAADALAPDGNGNLCAGGIFSSAGSNASSFFGIWHRSVCFITGTAGTGGAIEPSGVVSVPRGANQSFAIIPNAGYRVADVLVDDISVGPVTDYTFYDVTEDHGITASFIAVGACCQPNGTCTITTENECTYSWHGDWDSCAPNPCPPPTGACCYDSGACALTVQAECTGIWHSDLPYCDPNPCPRPGPLLEENFDFTGNLTANGWAAHSGAGTNPIAASPPGLAYTGYPSVLGNSASMTTSGEDDNRMFPPHDFGSVYYAFLVNFSAAQTAGDYFIHLAWIPDNRFYARVYAKLVSGAVSLGVTRQNLTPINYSTATFPLNTTHLIVVKYTFVPGSTNDTVDLFIDPVIGPTEPPPLLSATDVNSADATLLGAIALRQGSSNNAPTQRVDGIRVGASWIDIFPPKADLLVQECDPDSVVAGMPVTLTVTVKNEGNGTAPATMTRVTVDGDVKCDQIATPVLQAGQSAQVECVFAALPVGIHEVQILADATGLVEESSEANNSLTYPLVVWDAAGGVEDEGHKWETALLGATPNPFMGTTTMRYTLAVACRAQINIFDAAGRRVRTLDGLPERPGLHSAVWDGRNDMGARVGSGIYYLNLVTPQRTWSRAIVLIR